MQKNPTQIHILKILEEKDGYCPGREQFDSRMKMRNSNVFAPMKQKRNCCFWDMGSVAERSKAFVLGTSHSMAWVRIPPLPHVCFYQLELPTA